MQGGRQAPTHKLACRRCMLAWYMTVQRSTFSASCSPSSPLSTRPTVSAQNSPKSAQSCPGSPAGAVAKHTASYVWLGWQAQAANQSVYRRHCNYTAAAGQGSRQGVDIIATPGCCGFTHLEHELRRHCHHCIQQLWLRRHHVLPQLLLHPAPGQGRGRKMGPQWWRQRQNSVRRG